MKEKFTLFVYLNLFILITTNSQTLRKEFDVTDGTVHTQVQVGNTLYLGGTFEYIGPNVPNGAIVDRSTGEVNYNGPRPNGRVWAVIPDNNGGWYIGGEFTKVGNETRNGIAHILSDGALDSWNPGCNGIIRAMALQDTVLYAGGDFTEIGGKAVRFIGALYTTIPYAVSHWNPIANGLVYTLLLYKDFLYVGGNFTAIGGKSVGHLAKLHLPTGEADIWNPEVNNAVNAISLGGRLTAVDSEPSLLLIGGSFTSVNGQPRNYLAAFDQKSGVLSSWDPKPNNRVTEIEAYEKDIYISGNFTQVGGESRFAFAVLSSDSNIPDAWAPALNSGLDFIERVGNTLYIGGGALQSVNGQIRRSLASFDVTTKQLTSWTCHAPYRIWCGAVANNKIYVGGEFNSIGGEIRNYLAAIDVNTGKLTSWNPNPNWHVYALANSNDTIYVGGAFTSISGKLRTRIAAVSTSGTLFDWNPPIDGSVRNIIVDNGLAIGRTTNTETIYVSGDFTNAGGQARNGFAALSTSSNMATSFNPATDGKIYTIQKFQNVIYAGGEFTQIGGQQRLNLAALNATTGLATSQNLNTNGPVYAIANHNDFIFVGGEFSSVMGFPRNRLALIYAPLSGFGFMLNFVHSSDAMVRTLKNIKSDQLYIGGDFTSIDGQQRNRIALIDLQNDQLNSWNPDANGPVHSISLSERNIYVGGNFSMIAGQSASNFAVLASPISLPVKLQSFTAHRNSSGKVICAWVTAQEQNSSHFIVERSVDRIQYIPIGNVTAAGNSSTLHSYHFTDPSPVNETAYYRLKQVDLDASYVYSKVVAITGGKENSVVVLYPNPVKEQATLMISVQTKEKLRFSLFDQAGRTVISRDLLVSAGSNSVNIPTAGLAKGMYTIQIQGPNTERTLQMIKE
jgi:hypothetical protein